MEVAGLGLSAADLVLRLVVANRTGGPLVLRDLAYEATVDGEPFRTGTVPGPLALPAGMRVEVPIAATVGYGEAGGKVLALVSRGEVGYHVTGTVRVEGPGGASVERFDESGRVGVTGVRP